jgi:hypothetical protein
MKLRSKVVASVCTALLLSACGSSTMTREEAGQVYLEQICATNAQARLISATMTIEPIDVAMVKSRAKQWAMALETAQATLKAPAKAWGTDVADLVTSVVANDLTIDLEYAKALSAATDEAAVKAANENYIAKIGAVESDSAKVREVLGLPAGGIADDGCSAS